MTVPDCHKFIWTPTLQIWCYLQNQNRVRNCTGGTPAWSASSAAARAVNGVSSAGFMITVHPAASAGATCNVKINSHFRNFMENVRWHRNGALESLTRVHFKIIVSWPKSNTSLSFHQIWRFQHHLNTTSTCKVMPRKNLTIPTTMTDQNWNWKIVNVWHKPCEWSWQVGNSMAWWHQLPRLAAKCTIWLT